MLPSNELMVQRSTALPPNEVEADFKENKFQQVYPAKGRLLRFPEQRQKDIGLVDLFLTAMGMKERIL